MSKIYKLITDINFGKKEVVEGITYREHVEQINPAIARMMLENDMAPNRDLSTPFVRALKRDMESKRYQYNPGHPILINDDGKVFDAKHTLSALSMCEEWVKIYVKIVKGCPKALMLVLDQGKARKLNNILQIFGHFRASDKAAMVNVVFAYFENKFRIGSNGVPEDERYEYFVKHRLEFERNFEEVMKFKDQLYEVVTPDYGRETSVAKRSKPQPSCPVGIMAAMRMIFSRISEKDTISFFRQFLNEDKCVHVDIQNLRNAFMDGLLCGEKQEVKTACIITAWNSFRGKTKLSNNLFRSPKTVSLAPEAI